MKWVFTTDQVSLVFHPSIKESRLDQIHDGVDKKSEMDVVLISERFLNEDMRFLEMESRIVFP